jgi:hypothetical protein
VETLERSNFIEGFEAPRHQTAKLPSSNFQICTPPCVSICLQGIPLRRATCRSQFKVFLLMIEAWSSNINVKVFALKGNLSNPATILPLFQLQQSSAKSLVFTNVVTTMLHQFRHWKSSELSDELWGWSLSKMKQLSGHAKCVRRTCLMYFLPPMLTDNVIDSG